VDYSPTHPQPLAVASPPALAVNALHTRPLTHTNPLKLEHVVLWAHTYLHVRTQLYIGASRLSPSTTSLNCGQGQPSRTVAIELQSDTMAVNVAHALAPALVVGMLVVLFAQMSESISQKNFF
jgi:hypothetical protein